LENLVLVDFGFLLFVELGVFVSGGLLVLLIFADQVVHVALGLGEFHLVHALASVPMQESLATESRKPKSTRTKFSKRFPPFV